MWTLPPDPSNEAERLAALKALAILDTPSDERFDRLTYLARTLYRADVAFLSFIDSDCQWMKSVTSEEISVSIDRKLSVCQLIISTGEPLMSPDLKSDPRFEGHPTVPLLSLRFYAGVPLIIAPDLAIGTLCVMRREPETGDEAFDFTPLQALAAIAVDALELWRRNAELAQESRIDTLTGLANRRGFDEALARAASRCRRTGEPLALLAIDIDRFKSINDLAGHAHGDAVLRQVGRTLAQAKCRLDDIAARPGGEEFAIILPACGLTGALKAAERIRAALAEAAIVRPDGGSLTASIGVATLSEPDIDERRLTEAADAALYRAKRAGRNRIECPDGASQAAGEEMARG